MPVKGCIARLLLLLSIPLAGHAWVPNGAADSVAGVAGSLPGAWATTVSVQPSAPSLDSRQLALEAVRPTYDDGEKPAPRPGAVAVGLGATASPAPESDSMLPLCQWRSIRPPARAPPTA